MHQARSNGQHKNIICNFHCQLDLEKIILDILGSDFCSCWTHVFLLDLHCDCVEINLRSSVWDSGSKSFLRFYFNHFCEEMHLEEGKSSFLVPWFETLIASAFASCRTVVARTFCPILSQFCVFKFSLWGMSTKWSTLNYFWKVHLVCR